MLLTAFEDSFHLLATVEPFNVKKTDKKMSKFPLPDLAVSILDEDNSMVPSTLNTLRGNKAMVIQSNEKHEMITIDIHYIHLSVNPFS